MMKTVLASLVIGASLLLPAQGLFGGKGEPGRDRNKGGDGARVMEVAIGAVLPLTGVVASDGEAALRGLQIAEADINESGDLPFRVRLLVRDGKFEPRESLNAFNLLVSQNVAGMLLIGDNTCQMTKRQVEKKKLPTIASMVVTERSLKGNAWMLRSWPPIASSSRIMARYMRRDGKKKSVAVFHIDAVYGLESCRGFERSFAAEGGRVVARESFPFLASDLRAQIAKLLSACPDGIYVTGIGQGLVTAINQLREAGYADTIYTDTAVVDPRVKKNLVSLDRIVFIGNAFDEECSKGGSAVDLAEKYRRLTGRPAADVPPQVPFAYTAAKLLVYGLAEARGDRGAVMAAIEKLRNYPTVIGNVSYGPDREIVLPLYVKTFGPDGRNKLIDAELWREP